MCTQKHTYACYTHLLDHTYIQILLAYLANSFGDLGLLSCLDSQPLTHAHQLYVITDGNIYLYLLSCISAKYSLK
jgi:hypothetical protein